MNLSELLQLKYPNANFLHDILLSDHGDGNGPVISKWNLPDLQPTQEQLTQWTIELQPAYEAQQRNLQFSLINADLLMQLEAIDKRSIRALRENDTTKIEELNSQASALRSKLIRN